MEELEQFRDEQQDGEVASTLTWLTGEPHSSPSPAPNGAGLQTRF